VVIWRLPNAVSTIAGGSMLNGGSLSLPFYLCAALYLASITIFYTLFRSADKAPTGQF
jgi:predicted MFS family arabinose efflux permease